METLGVVPHPYTIIIQEKFLGNKGTKENNEIFFFNFFILRIFI